MLVTRRINSPPTETYLAKYGPRTPRISGTPVHAFGKEFDFIRPREGLSHGDFLQSLTPEWAGEMEYTIMHFNENSIF